MPATSHGRPHFPRRMVVVKTSSGRHRRTAVTQRDEELLRWLVRFGVATPAQLTRLFFPSPTTCRRRLLRLERGGFIVREAAAADIGAVVRVTRAGARLADCDLPAIALDHGKLRHTLALADLAHELLRRHPKATWVTERELRRDRLRGEHGGTAKRRTPDGLLLLEDGRRIAVELDLTPKRSGRLHYLASLYALDPGVSCVWWYQPSGTAAGRMRATTTALGLDRLIEVREWKRRHV